MKQTMITIMFFVLLTVMLASANSQNIRTEQLNSIMSVQSFLPSTNDYTNQIKTSNRDFRLVQVLSQTDYGMTGNFQNNKKKIMFYDNNTPDRVESVTNMVYVYPDLYWGTGSVIQNTWDVANNHLDSATYASGPGQPVMSRYSMLYDDLNRITDVTLEYRYDVNMDLVVMDRYHMFYTGENLTGRDIYHRDIIDGSVIYYRSAYTNDAQGRIVSETRSMSADSLNWDAWLYTSLTYLNEDTSTGNEFIEAISHSGMLGCIYTTLTTGKLSQVDNQMDGNDGLYTSGRTLYSYDAEARLITQIEQSTTSDSLRNSILYNLVYDVNGNISTISTSNWDVNNEVWYAPFEMDTYTFEAVQFSGTEDNNATSTADLRLSTYPNPFSNNLMISVSSKAKAPVNASIFNTKGQLVYSIKELHDGYQWSGKDNNNKSLPIGIYFLRAEQGGKTASHKIIKLN